jgi:DNA mismatch repair protein MSH5
VVPEVQEAVGVEKMKQISAIDVVYFPRLGFMVAMNIGSSTKSMISERSEWTQLPNLEFRFSQQEVHYYKTKKMRDLDEEIGDINGLIMDKEVEILHDLEMRVKQILAPQTLPNVQTAADSACFDFLTLVDVTTELDVVLTLAWCSHVHKWIKPEVTESGAVKIKNGRHPIQKELKTGFVPNDTVMCHEAYGRCMVITGANGSGKSVYLKQIGLIVLLSHIGCYVPADSCSLPVFKRMFGRLQNMETVMHDKSAFAIDLCQVKRMIDASTPQTLLLIDEFGKGTCTDDGVGLCAASLRHLMKDTETMPYIIMTTHFHELFQHDLLKGLPIDMWTMQVMMKFRGGMTAFSDQYQRSKEDDEIVQDVSYLYKLMPGRSEMSLGVCCAQLAGLDASLIHRGKLVSYYATHSETLVCVASVVAESFQNGTTLIEPIFTPDEAERLQECEVIWQEFAATKLTSETVSDLLSRIA